MNSILPVKASVVEAEPVYGMVPEFNAQLQQMCEKEGLTYIDNTGLVEEEAFYEEDGIHMSPDYYTKWVEHMAEVAKIIMKKQKFDILNLLKYAMVLVFIAYIVFLNIREGGNSTPVKTIRKAIMAVTKEETE